MVAINTDEKPRIIPNFVKKPTIIGNHGYDLSCSKCSHLLIKQILDRQILGLIIICPVCKTRNQTQERSPGEPISSRAVVLQSRDYNTNDSIDCINKPVLMVSSKDLQEYKKEVGFQFSKESKTNGFDKNFIDQLVSKAIDFLSTEEYEKQLSSYKRSIVSKTPSTKIHRLVDLIEYIKPFGDALDKEGSSAITIDANRLSELICLVEMFERWKQHPASKSLRSSLASSDNVQHSLMQLVVASYLADQGNGVGLIFKDVDGQRIPDIFIKPTFLEQLQVEIKTPVALHGPINDKITPEKAHEIIENLIDKAASTKSGQIDPQHSGAVAIGGFHLDPDTVNLLEKTTKSILAKQVARKKHLAAVMICNLTYLNKKIVDDHGKTMSQSFVPIMIPKIIKHPGYKGDLNLKT